MENIIYLVFDPVQPRMGYFELKDEFRVYMICPHLTPQIKLDGYSVVDWLCAHQLSIL